MKFIRELGIILSLLLLLVGLVLLMAVLTTGGTLAQGPALPTPTDVSGGGGGGGDDDSDSDRSRAGAYIELQIEPARAGLRATVQWQDSAGGWHDVEGWDHRLNGSGYQRWWVAAKDFNTGPFHWIVTSEPGGQMQGAGQFFNLPDRPNMTRRVVISLQP